jgi:hypothetical protein
MKKVIFAFILIMGAFQLKAQSLFQVKSSDSLSNKLFDKYFNMKPAEKLTLLQPRLNSKELLNGNDLKNTVSYDEVFYSRMPVAVLQGYDKMPVVVLEGYSKMPVKKIDTDDPLDTAKKSLSGVPAF